jgi:hypothetical protein
VLLAETGAAGTIHSQPQPCSLRHLCTKVKESLNTYCKAQPEVSVAIPEGHLGDLPFFWM